MTSLLGLRSAVEHLSKLINIFQMPPQQIQSRQIRSAEKIVVHLHGFFNTELKSSIELWEQKKSAEKILSTRLNEIESLEQQRAEHFGERILIEDHLVSWNKLPSTEQQKILQYGALAKQYLQQKTFEKEAYIVHRYRRYESLKQLAPYADNHEHLCEAIHHFLNRERYEENIKRLTEKNIDAEKRLKTVHRGFVLALCMCIFVVTIPLCLPFAISLWSRRKDIQKQIANTTEALKREERRLVAADEGVIAYSEIQPVLGDKSTEEIRSALKELQDLKNEFHGPHKNTSVTSNLLTFLSLYQKTLTQVFGNVPQQIPESILWLANHVENTERLIAQKHSHREAEISLETKIRKLTKGYSKDFIEKNRANLQYEMDRLFDLPMSQEFLPEFIQTCVQCSETLEEVKNVFSLVVHGHVVPDNKWMHVKNTLHSLHTILASCIIDIEMNHHTYEEGARL